MNRRANNMADAEHKFRDCNAQVGLHSTLKTS